MNEFLVDLIAAAKAKGYMGIALWDQGGKCGQMAALITKDFRPEPIWDTQLSPHEALKALARKLGMEHAAAAASEA